MRRLVLASVFCIAGLLVCLLLAQLLKTPNEPVLPQVDPALKLAPPSAELALAREPAERASVADQQGSEEGAAVSRDVEPASTRPHITGIACLEDGTPLPKLRLIAVPANGPISVARFARGEQLDLALGKGLSDASGEFEIALDDAGHASESFVLLQLTHPALGQNLRVYERHDQQPLRHALPWGALPVRVLDENGVAASNVEIIAFGAAGANPESEYALRRVRSDSEGRALFFFGETLSLRVVANSADGMSSVEASDVAVWPGTSVPELELRLSSFQNTGRLKVEVKSESGLDLTDFAVRIEHTGERMQSRFVYSSSLGPDQIIDGLPPGTLSVALMPKYVAPPTLYITEGLEPQSVTLNGTGVAQLTFEVEVFARLLIDLERNEPSATSLRVRARDTSSGPTDWLDLRSIHLFLEHGGTIVGASVREGYQYYSDLLPAGLLEIEVFEPESGEVKWSGQAQLTPGVVTRVQW